MAEDEFDYKTSLQKVILFASLLIDMQSKLEKIDEQMSYSEGVGCYVDPTLWMRGIDVLTEQHNIVRAMLTASKEMAPVKEKIRELLVKQGVM